MSYKIISTFLFLLFIIGCAPQTHESISYDITKIELQNHIKYLTSEKLAGRASGEEGNRFAAEYIANEFKKYGLQSMGDNQTYFQSFRLLSGVKPGKNNILSIQLKDQIINLKSDEDFRPLPYSLDTSVTAGLVFVGYSISADTLNYDDYAGMDVRGKIVMMLRFTPDMGVPTGKFYGHEFMHRKVFLAREKGAAGIILVTGPVDEVKPDLLTMKLDRQFLSTGLPIVNLKSTIADSLLRLAGIEKNLREIQQQIYDTKKPFSFEVPQLSITMKTEVSRVYTQTANVLGFLEGNDPTVKKEILVIGAHFDHLGFGGEGSGSLKPDTVAIHPGADDNASGTAGLLEVAQYLSSQRISLRRSILFTAFSGEEIGLLGSDYYTKNPVLPLENTIAMINMDMIGRMKESTLVIDGMGSSSRWEELIKQMQIDSSIRVKLKPDGLGPSDHASFYKKDIPVMFFFTNIHQDYHRPSDTWEKINYDGEKKVTQMVVQIATKLTTEDEKPLFTKVQSTSAQMSGERRSTRVSLGVVPDFADEGAGMKISGTRPGSAAEKAGLKAGDLIIKFKGKDIKNIYDFTQVLSECKPGDEVIIVVKRGAEEHSLTALLETRRQE